PGTYTLSEKSQSNWDQTYPLTPGIYTIQLFSGDSLTDKNFGNYLALANSITLRCFRDKDGNFSTRDDLVSKRWNLRLYSDSISSGTLVKDTSASSFTLLNVTPGTYIAVEADSSGWSHIGKLRDTIAFEGAYNKDTITISTDESHVVTFVNFHPNTVTIKKFKDNDGNFATAGDRSTKKWNLSLYKGLIQPQNLIASVNSAESLLVTNIGEGTYTALETDSSGWTHIGTILDGIGTASSLNYIQLNVDHGGTHKVDFINARLGSITVTKFLDQDGDFRTGEGSLKSWSLKLYRIIVSDTSIVDSVNSASTLTKSGLPEGTYLAAEADSGHPWSHIATELYSGAILEQRIGGTQNKIPFSLSGGQSRHVRFINFNRNRVKYWTAIQDCEWSNGLNWEPPGVPIPGDSIIVPDTAHCRLLIPSGSLVGTIVVASQESVCVSSGSFESSGDVLVNGTMFADTTDFSTITVGGDWRVNDFISGKSTIIFTGANQQTIEGTDLTFYKMKINDGAPNTINMNGNFKVSDNFYNGGNIDADGDTIFIMNSSANALSGSGRILRGTLLREIQQASISRYQFESDESYIEFNGSGTYPSTISMTIYPDTIPTNFGDEWETIPSVVDTTSNTVTANNIDKFSKWPFGIPRPKIATNIPVVRRMYVTP
ncbi:MAG: hypothetical protein HY800_03310, partial [Ignavibacteriales bacterium]|nr:hypothetical protein [Ignavibacteriales bacterium]